MIYKTNTYWEERYNRDGINAPVAKNVHARDKYEDRVIDDSRIIDETLGQLIKPYSAKLVIDCGCGCGRLTPTLFKYAKNVKGFDISPKAISLAQQRKDILGSSYSGCGVEFICSPLTSLPLKDDTVNLSLSWTVLQHISDVDEWKQSIDEIQRVVKKDGLILTYDNIEWNLKLAQTPDAKVPEHMSVKSANDYLVAFDRCECIHQRMYNKHVLTLLRKIQ